MLASRKSRDISCDDYLCYTRIAGKNDPARIVMLQYFDTLKDGSLNGSATLFEKKQKLAEERMAEIELRRKERRKKRGKSHRQAKA